MDMRNCLTWPRVMVPFVTKSGQICLIYNVHPAMLSELGSSDHRMVLLVPSSYPTLDTGMIQNRVIRRMGATERMTFGSALCRVRWEYMYAMDSCEQQFQFFQETMTDSDSDSE